MTIKIEKKQRTEQTQRYPVFEYDGATYYVQGEPNPSLLMRYAFMVRHEGLIIAESWLGEALLGTDTFQTLINIDGITPDEVSEIMGLARKIVFGEVAPEAVDDDAPLEDSSTPEPASPPKKRTSKAKQ